MPLFKSIAIDNQTHILIWEITETEKELSKEIKLSKTSTNRLQKMKSEMHRRAFLSVRNILAIANYEDADLTYNERGKPFLSDGVHISITHSNQYAGVIFGGNPVGIDIEKQRDKITRVSSKFISEKEEQYLIKDSQQHKIEKLTFIWCAKEAIYKLHGKHGLSFKNNMDVAPFDTHNLQTKACVNYKENIIFHDLNGLEFNGFTCAFVN